jgi:hypothetical protein
MIKCEPPNYRPAQLLYAYAMENVLKGRMIANERKLIGEHKLSDEIKCHNLVVLAEKVKCELCTQEKRVMEALSKISVWAGGYPVATTADTAELSTLTSYWIGEHSTPLCGAASIAGLP